MTKTKQGFTLIELLVTMSIMSIMVSFAAPSFSRFMVNQQLDASARHFQSGLMLVRSEGIKRNNRVYLTQNNDWTDGYIITTNIARTYAECAVTATADCIKIYNSPTAAYSVAVSEVGTKQLTYLKSGRHSLANFSFTICPVPVDTGFSQRIVTIGTTGMPQITHGASCT